MQTHVFTAADGYSLTGTRFDASKPVAAVVIAPAMGVPQKFYFKFARHLAESGFVTLTFDYRGTQAGPGAVLLQNPDGSEISLLDWATDIDGAIRAMRERHKHVFLVGHSIGGQLVGLAPAAQELTGIVMTASQLANWRLWPFPVSLAMWGLWRIAIPLLSLGTGQAPARRLGLGTMDVPKGVTRQWAEWARRRDYLFDARFEIDTSGYERLTCPVLAYSFDDDGYAPLRTTEALIKRMPNVQTQIEVVSAQNEGIGAIKHFGFYKEKARPIWERTVGWMKAKLP